MRRTDISEQARRDILDVWHYIATDSVEAANRVSFDIINAIEKLAKLPGLGHFRPDVRSRKLRCYCIFSYIIIYRVDPDQLVVIRVVHGARDFRKLF